MADFVDPIQYETGTAIQTFDIIEANSSADGYEVLLNIDLDSGFELRNVKLNITADELLAYETTDIHEAVTYALGFFHQS